MCSHLLWELTKNNNSFLVKRRGVQFSSDPFNLINRNQYSYSGLAHNWSMVSIQAPKKGTKSGAPARYDLKFTKKRNYAQKGRTVKTDSKTLNADQKYSFFAEHVPVKGVHTAAKILKKKLTKTHGRGDLLRAALRRLALTHRANVVKKVLAKTQGGAPAK